MTQNQIESSVARATGESVAQIRRMGFSLADPMLVNFDPEPDLRRPLIVDWDQLEFSRQSGTAQHLDA